MIEIVRRTQRNVKRWSSGEMALRWTAADMLEAERQFRKIIGYRDARRRDRTRPRPLQSHRRCRSHLDQGSRYRPHHLTITAGPPPKIHGARDILVVSARGATGSAPQSPRPCVPQMQPEPPPSPARPPSRSQAFARFRHGLPPRRFPGSAPPGSSMSHSIGERTARAARYYAEPPRLGFHVAAWIGAFSFGAGRFVT